MTTNNQRSLSDFIKSIHKNLREEAKVLGTERAWKNHCENRKNLEQYAIAMKELAVNYWNKNSETDNKVVSRVFWVFDACIKYFHETNKYREKEVKIAMEYLKIDVTGFPKIYTSNNNGKYKVLDVGSCYNPFRKFKIFDVLPIDIAPENKQVFECDFLNVKISRSLVIENTVVEELPEESFDVVIFSLLLEYLPCPDLRLKCCLNAYNLLKHEGILVIITPDSNHVGSNAKIIKSWRYILAKQGFIRVKYEKVPYLHCMVFRKAILTEVACRWAEVHASEGFFERIYIPQDLQNRKSAANMLKQNENGDNLVKWSSEAFLSSFDSCSTVK